MKHTKNISKNHNSDPPPSYDGTAATVSPTLMAKLCVRYLCASNSAALNAYAAVGVGGSWIPGGELLPAAVAAAAAGLLDPLHRLNMHYSNQITTWGGGHQCIHLLAINTAAEWVLVAANPAVRGRQRIKHDHKSNRAVTAVATW